MKLKLILTILLSLSLYQVSVAAKIPAKIFTPRFNPNLGELYLNPKQAAKSNDDLGEYFFDQKLDHFNSSDTRTFEMLYLENSDYYRPGGPIFLILGAQNFIFDSYVQKDEMYYADLAEQHNALLLCLEHRYYGQSSPFDDTRTEHLKYLTVDQTLADIAAFITYIKSSKPELNYAKVILLGFSYSGGLATWFSHLYPALVDGVWSASGMVFPRAGNELYKIASGEVYRTKGSVECNNAIQEGFDEVEALIDAGKPELIEELFDLCEPMDTNNTLDVQTFLFYLGETFASLPQFVNDVYPSICRAMTNATYESKLHALADMFNKITGFGCTGFTYQDHLEYLSTNSPYSPQRQFFYTMCTELGWFATTSPNLQPFGTKVTLDYFAQLCTDVFGRQITTTDIQNNARRASIKYGADQGVYRRVVSTHGELDPWRPVGMSVDRSGESPVYVNKDQNHCTDIVYPVEESPEELEPVRSYVNFWISRWIV